MASEVSICNLALSHLGDAATVSSIDPPEGSAQAEHCAQFYSIARDSLLEMHDWKFSLRRTLPVQVTSESTMWQYAYSKPSDALRILQVIPSDATDDNNNLLWSSDLDGYVPSGSYTTQPFKVELYSDGNEVIYTDQSIALLRYTKRVTDPSKFSPLFTLTLSYHLASMLAGPVLKGDAAIAVNAKMLQAMAYWLAKASISDANQSQSSKTHVVGWMAAR